MTVLGYVIAVDAVEQGSTTIAASAGGATTLAVDDPTPYDETGGVVDVLGVRLTYTSVTEDPATGNGTITLATPLATAVDEASPVWVVLGGEVAVDYIAHVDLGGDGGDDAQVLIPFEQREKWPLGQYNDPVQVVLSNDLTQIVDVPGRVPVLDLSYADPTTIPEFVPVDPPPTASAPIVTAGPDFFVLRVDNADAAWANATIEYHVTLDATTPTAGDSDTLLAATKGVLVARTLPNGAPFQTGTTYTFWAIAVNAAGSAPSSPPTTAVLDPSAVQGIVTSEVTAGFIVTGKVRVGQAYFDADEGLVLPQPDGTVTIFPVDGVTDAAISGFVAANGLAVHSGAYFYGVSQVSGELQLGAGVKNPTVAPKIVQSHPISYFPSYDDHLNRMVGFQVGVAYPFHGLTLDRSNNINGLESRLATSGADGSISFFDRFTLRTHRAFNVFDDMDAADYNHGIARSMPSTGGEYYVLASPRVGGLETGEWFIRVYNADHFEVGYDDDAPSDRYYQPGETVPSVDSWSVIAAGAIAGQAAPMIGMDPNDDNTLWLAYVPVSTDNLVIEEWDVATQTKTATHTYPDVAGVENGTVDAIFVDLETDRIFVSVVGSTLVKAFNRSTWLRDTSLDFFKHVPVGETPEPVGMYSTNQGPGFTLIGALADRLVNYDGPTTSVSGTIRYTWGTPAGDYETAGSPTLAAATQRRARTNVICAAPPHRGVIDSTITHKANTVRLYVLDGGDYDLLQTFTTDAVSTVLTDFVPLSSSTHPPAVNEFDALGVAPGFIDSVAADGAGPIIKFLGDGSGRFGELDITTAGALTGDSARLGKTAKTAATSWDNATLNGWWIGTNLTNGPLATGKFLVRVLAESTTNLVQIATQLTTGATNTWRRDRVSGTWGSWQRLGVYNSHWRTTDVSVAHNTWSTVPFPTGNNDPEFTGTTTFTIPYTGRYAVVGQIAFRGNATGRRSVRLLHNGSTVILESEPNVASSGTGPHCLPISGVFDLTAGDTIEVQAFQTSGAGLNLAGTQSQTFVNIDRIR